MRNLIVSVCLVFVTFIVCLSQGPSNTTLSGPVGAVGPTGATGAAGPAPAGTGGVFVVSGTPQTATGFIVNNIGTTTEGIQVYNPIASGSSNLSVRSGATQADPFDFYDTNGTTKLFQINSGGSPTTCATCGIGFNGRATVSSPSGSEFQMNTGGSSAFGKLYLGAKATTTQIALSVTAQANPVLTALDGNSGSTAQFHANKFGGVGSSPTVAAGGAIGTTPTIAGTDFVGTVSVPSTVVTIGTIATVTFGTAYGTTAPQCWVSQNGGTVAVGVGHGTPGLTTFTITSAIANVSATTYTFDYGCANGL